MAFNDVGPLSADTILHEGTDLSDAAHCKLGTYPVPNNGDAQSHRLSRLGASEKNKKLREEKEIILQYGTVDDVFASLLE